MVLILVFRKTTGSGRENSVSKLKEYTSGHNPGSWIKTVYTGINLRRDLRRTCRVFIVKFYSLMSGSANLLHADITLLAMSQLRVPEIQCRYYTGKVHKVSRPFCSRGLSAGSIRERFPRSFSGAHQRGHPHARWHRNG